MINTDLVVQYVKNHRDTKEGAPVHYTSVIEGPLPLYFSTAVFLGLFEDYRREEVDDNRAVLIATYSDDIKHSKGNNCIAMTIIPKHSMLGKKKGKQNDSGRR